MSSASPVTRPGLRRFRLSRYLGAVFVACALLVTAAIPAAAAELMRMTFIRHGQSLGNASGSIDSSTPGPVLSELGRQQAADVAARLGDKNYDAVYASSMVRTQLTAAPLSQYLGLPIRVLNGLQEIEAGDYEGTPESEAASGYMLAPLAWALQGNLDARIPGSIDGHEFDARMNGALQAIYDSGSRNSAVFSHGAAMMFWTFMNVDNLTAAQKMELLRASLRNTADVVIEGNPEDGWKLVSWDGRQFSAERTLVGELQVQLRTLVRQVGAEVRSVFQAFATRDLSVIVNAVNRAAGSTAFSFIKFTRAMNADVVERIEKAVARVFPAPRSAVPADSTAPAVAASRSTATEAPESVESAEPVRDKGRPVAAVSAPVADVVEADEAVEAEVTAPVDAKDETTADPLAELGAEDQFGSDLDQKTDELTDKVDDRTARDTFVAEADQQDAAEAETNADATSDATSDAKSDNSADGDDDAGVPASVGAASASMSTGGGSSTDD